MEGLAIHGSFLAETTVLKHGVAFRNETVQEETIRDETTQDENTMHEKHMMNHGGWNRTAWKCNVSMAVGLKS